MSSLRHISFAQTDKFQDGLVRVRVHLVLVGALSIERHHVVPAALEPAGLAEGSKRDTRSRSLQVHPICASRTFR